MAFTSRFSNKQVIQEYPVNDDGAHDDHVDDRTRTSSGNSETIPYGSIDNQIKVE